MGKDKSAKKFGKASRYDSYLDVEKYWKEYYEIVGEQGDDLQTLIAQAKKKVITVIEDGFQAAYNLKTKEIIVSQDTKQWEFFEELLHKKVYELGWKKDKIAETTKRLRKVKDFKGRKQIKAPASAAEEIIVKTWLLEHGSFVGVGKAEKILLQKQIDRLNRYGMPRRY